MDSSNLSDRVRTAHGDAWEVQGRLRVPDGGGYAELPGIRLMASGLDHPQWNNADVTDSGVVDVDEVRAWYLARGLPWGVRVPRGMPWPHGRHLFVKRLMGCTAAELTPAPVSTGTVLREADVADLDAVVAVDSIAFDSDPVAQRPWLAPHLAAASTTVVVAVQGDEPVGTAYTVLSDGRAGPAVYLAGVAVLPRARGRGIGAAMSGWLVQRGFSNGAKLAHLHPNGDATAHIYAGLGFTEVGGFDVYVMNDSASGTSVS